MFCPLSTQHMPLFGLHAHICLTTTFKTINSPFQLKYKGFFTYSFHVGFILNHFWMLLKVICMISSFLRLTKSLKFRAFHLISGGFVGLLKSRVVCNSVGSLFKNLIFYLFSMHFPTHSKSCVEVYCKRTMSGVSLI